MGRRIHPQGLGERDAQHHARLCIVWQDLAGCAVDQRVEIGQRAQHFGGDGVGERAILPRQSLRRAVQRQFERLAPAQHGVQQPQRRAARWQAGDIIGTGAGRTGRRTRGHWRPLRPFAVKENGRRLRPD
jgi:hypothetical protein